MVINQSCVCKCVGMKKIFSVVKNFSSALVRFFCVSSGRGGKNQVMIVPTEQNHHTTKIIDDQTTMRSEGGVLCQKSISFGKACEKVFCCYIDRCSR